MARDKGQFNWADMPIEMAVGHALTAAGANDRLKNAITTNEVAQALVDLGFPADRDTIAREVCSLACEYEKKRIRQRIVDGQNVHERFTGASWIGARTPSEPWNRHEWALPMWQGVGGV